MKVDYIIVQAGGKGTRMKQLTTNKPKALVPVNNLPMIFHLFRLFPDKKYIVIGDYKYDVLKKYLEAFCDVDYTIVDARGLCGTCAGLLPALELIPENEAFMLIWSDLILPNTYTIPEENGNYIGISKGFTCRWKYVNNQLIEERSREYGVAGHFIFENKKIIDDVPAEGEFVRWLSTKGTNFASQELVNTQEYGLLEDMTKLDECKCRPFNRMTFYDDYVIKEAIDDQGAKLAQREVAWYVKTKELDFRNTPQIYDTFPLKLERIKGKNIYDIDSSLDVKKSILLQLVESLKKIHNIEQCSTDRDSYYEAYIGKTFNRLEKVYNLVPFAKDRTLKINGKDCPNVFYLREELTEKVMKYLPDKFCLIHGDCTFSNMMIREDGTPVMIDPRGYFGNTELYGDAAYDWVKIYYSIVGNYDQFNLKRFTLKINEVDVELTIESNHWEELEDYYFELLEPDVTREQIKLLHAITYLSLTTYAWQDYDSVCAAFYKGLLLLSEVLL